MFASSREHPISEFIQQVANQRLWIALQEKNDVI